MFLFHLFRSFLPAQNPIGFGAADFIELLLALAGLLCALFARPYVEPLAARLARNTVWCMLLCGALPVILRLALLPHHPVPTPNIADEFSHLLVADTLRHFRFANPTHPLHQFFETFFVLQQPTYSSIYPLGQGLVMALAWNLFGLPWAGVVLSTAAFCALCYWMLRGWVSPRWALVGGLLAGIEFGPLCMWMNDYWGGAFAATSGCLVFGALPRLRERARVRDGVLLGAGMAMHLLTRPYESILMAIGVALYFLPLLRGRTEWTRLVRPSACAALLVTAAIGITLAQNRRVTGAWFTFPYAVSQYQYGVPAPLTFQAPLTPHRALTPQQQTEYEIQHLFPGTGPETPAKYLTRLEYRVHFFRFFFLPPLYLALAAFLMTIRQYRYLWVLLTLILFTLGLNLFPAFQFHYFAGVTCLFVLMSVAGLKRIGEIQVKGLRVGADAAHWLMLLCGLHFAFWYSMHLFDDRNFSIASREYETWDSINHENPERRIAVNQQLAALPGKLLVFVRYYPNHVSQDEWVWNGADIDAGRMVWARDLGPEENEKLRHYYPDRTAWLVEPDFRPMPRLAPYQVEIPAPVAASPKSPFETPH
jgi:hypothetical protein